jgi:uncharacterized protein (DUF2252 family)
MRWLAIAVLVAGCADALPSDREQRVLDELANDNYVWGLRDPALVALKLRKMQRGPYEWLRGTASLYWRDLIEPGGDRTPTSFGDAASSRVLLVGDPHPENVGTFRAADGTMLVDWNDLDAAGYGPFTADVRRLAVGMIVAADSDDGYADELAARVAAGYTAEIAAVAGGAGPFAIGVGAHPLLDKVLAKAQSRGDVRFAVDELAPISDGQRYVAFGDLEPIAADGLYEDTLQPVGAETAVWIDAAIAQWAARRGAPAVVKLRARRIGAGVSSYPALRYDVLLEGPTSMPGDDEIVELKEERDGHVLHGVPQYAAAEWSSPAARAVDAQRRLQSRRDADPQLGWGDLGGLSLKIRDREAYQRGLDHLDMAALAAGSASKRAQLLSLAELLGRLLASAHGNARTGDGDLGVTVIAPVLAGREAAFADELVGSARAEAAQVIDDHAALQDEDLAARVIR